jgi:hypothetical protein
MGKGLHRPSCRRGQGACLGEPRRPGWLVAVGGPAAGELAREVEEGSLLWPREPLCRGLFLAVDGASGG